MDAFQNAIQAEADTALVAVGGVAAHGAHLPLGADLLAAEAIAAAAEAAFPARSLLLPPLSVGHAWEMGRFAGTVNVTSRTLAELVVEIGIGAAAWGVRYVVVVNGQEGNGPALAEAAERIADRGVAVLVFNWWDALPADTDGGRGGEAETALVLALAPDLVASTRRPHNRRQMKYPGTYDEAALADVYRHGMRGDARGAGRAEGEAIFARICADLTERIQDLWADRLVDEQRRE